MVRQGYILKGNILVGDLFTKYGLDANVLVDLVLYPKAKEYFQQKGYSFPDKFLCTLHQCIGEAKGVLINRYNYSLEQADQELNKIMEDFMIEKSPAVVIEDDILIVEEIGQKYKLNEEDVPIIYGFWKLKINIVVVRDRAFENSCKELNINIIRWPHFN